MNLTSTNYLTDSLQHDGLFLQKMNQLYEWNVRNFTRLWNLEMQQMEAECPNAFFLIPVSQSIFNPKNWFSQDYKISLMCQYPQGPHCVEEKYSYNLHSSREWWIKVSPWLKYIIEFIKFGVPSIRPIGNIVDAVDFKKVEAQLMLLEKIIEELPEIEVVESVSPDEKLLQSVPKQSSELALRFLHSFLKEADPQQFWGGLVRRVTPDGNILWLCSTHAQPYNVQSLSLNL